MTLRRVFELVLGCILVHAATDVSVAAPAECLGYRALSIDDELQEYERSPLIGVSMFELITDHRRFLSRNVMVDGMLVREHGQTFLVPAGTRMYLYTGDYVEVEDRALPDCLLEALDGELVMLVGVLGERGGIPRVERVRALKEHPAVSVMKQNQERQSGH